MTKLQATALNACGIAAPLLWAMTVMYAGSRHPEYSHVRQYVSDLAARGSSTQYLMQVSAFILPGFMTAGFGLLLGRTADRVVGVAGALLIVSGLARATAGVFVPDPLDHAATPSVDEQIHNASGMLYVMTLILAVVVWIVASMTRRRPSIWCSSYSLLTVVTAVAAPFVLIAAGIATWADVGLFQRATLGTLNIWILTLACVRFAEHRYSNTVPASALA